MSCTLRLGLWLPCQPCIPSHISLLSVPWPHCLPLVPHVPLHRTFAHTGSPSWNVHPLPSHPVNSSPTRLSSGRVPREDHLDFLSRSLSSVTAPLVGSPCSQSELQVWVYSPDYLIKVCLFKYSLSFMSVLVC